MESHSTTDSGLNPKQLVHVLRTHVSWWATPAVACAVLAAAYSLVASREWRATQTFALRPEAASISEQRLGKFADLSEMKVQQATILELAKSQGVVQSTLQAVGPPSSLFGAAKNWPSATDVEEFRKQLDMRPPGGSEFGQTEVFYLSVLDSNRERAAKFVGALSEQLEKRLQTLRDERAQSMMAELEKTVAMAESDLNARTEKLAAFETAIGADLAELRTLNAMAGSQSEVSQVLQAIEGERRSNDVRQNENEQLLVVLNAAQQDPRQLVATPNSLLQSQPAISRLKDALVDAQVRTSNLLGTLTNGHPYVVAALETEQLVKQQLHDELAVAITGLEMDIKFNTGRDESLHKKLESSRERLARLASARAEYANLIAAVDNHTKLVEAARKNMADARADHASAHSASLIARIDGVDAGVRPVGPGRATITGAGGVAGLVLGFGLVFLFGNLNVGSVAAPSTGVPESQPQAAPVTAGGPKLPQEPFGLFRGMTLEEAVRRAEQRPELAAQ